MEKKVNKPLKIKLNNIQNLEALLQEMYDETSKNINEIQNEINKLSMSTNSSCLVPSESVNPFLSKPVISE